MSKRRRGKNKDNEAEKDKDNEELTNQALSALAALGYHVTAADLGKLNPPDVFESELELMAEVRAYFQIAYKVRFPPVSLVITSSCSFHILCHGNSE